MHDCDDAALVERWYPLAGSAEIPRRHVFQTQLLGEELAVWRADDGALNAWENRCPHRGVRLSIGTNLGSELRCQYHGIRFASGTGQSTFVPAHPDQPPPRALCARAYRCIERYGLVWASFGAGADAPSVAALDGAETVALRSLPVNASAPLVAEALMSYRFRPNACVDDLAAESDCSIEILDPFTFKITASAAGGSTTLMLFVQPVDRRRSRVHGCILGAVPDNRRLAVLRHHNERLSDLRNAIEETGKTVLELTAAPSPDGAAYRALIRGRLQYGTAA